MPLVHHRVGRRGPVVIAEAIDTGTRIGWAIVAWIAVGAAVLTVVLFTVVLTGAWAMRGAWRAARGVWTGRALRKPQAPVSRPQALPCDSRDAGTPRGPAQGPSRPAPSWAHADKEAA